MPERPPWPSPFPTATSRKCGAPAIRPPPGKKRRPRSRPPWSRSAAKNRRRFKRAWPLCCRAKAGVDPARAGHHHLVPGHQARRHPPARRRATRVGLVFAVLEHAGADRPGAGEPGGAAVDGPRRAGRRRPPPYRCAWPPSRRPARTNRPRAWPRGGCGVFPSAGPRSAMNSPKWSKKTPMRPPISCGLGRANDVRWQGPQHDDQESTNMVCARRPFSWPASIRPRPTASWTS